MQKSHWHRISRVALTALIASPVLAASGSLRAQEPIDTVGDVVGEAVDDLVPRLLTPAPVPPDATEPVLRLDDHDCKDFDWQEDAQAFYEESGGPKQDPHRLDRDRDGKACEGLASRPAKAAEVQRKAASSPHPGTRSTVRQRGHTRSGDEIEGQVVIQAQAADDKNCDDFKSQEEAQQFYDEAGPGDPHQLDSDKDGKPCEGLPGGTMDANTDPAPEPTVAPAAEDDDLPDSGANVAVLALTGMALVGSGLSMTAATRRRRESVAPDIAHEDVVVADGPQMEVMRAVVLAASRG